MVRQKAVGKLDASKPMIGMTSLGKNHVEIHGAPFARVGKTRVSRLRCFILLVLGGRAFETLVAQGRFVCVMDFCLQEFINGVNGSAVGSGDDRLTNAGINGNSAVDCAGRYRHY